MLRDGKVMVLIENYEPAEYMNSLIIPLSRGETPCQRLCRNDGVQAHRLRPQHVLNPYESDQAPRRIPALSLRLGGGDFRADFRPRVTRAIFRCAVSMNSSIRCAPCRRPGARCGMLGRTLSFRAWPLLRGRPRASTCRSPSSRPRACCNRREFFLRDACGGRYL